MCKHHFVPMQAFAFEAVFTHRYPTFKALNYIKIMINRVDLFYQIYRYAVDSFTLCLMINHTFRLAVYIFFFWMTDCLYWKIHD